MANYSGPIWQSTAGADKRGEFIMRGAEGFGEGVAKGIGKFSDNLKEMASNRDKAKALDASLDLIKSQAPGLVTPEFEEKFNAGGITQKSGMFTTLMGFLHRNDQTKEADRNFGLARRRVEVAEGGLLQAEEPVLPQETTLPSGATIIYNPRTGAWEQSPDNTGTKFNVPPGAPAGVLTHNGRPMGTATVPTAPEGYTVQYDAASGTYVATMDRKPVDAGNILTTADPNAVPPPGGDGYPTSNQPETTLFDGVGPPPPPSPSAPAWHPPMEQPRFIVPGSNPPVAPPPPSIAPPRGQLRPLLPRRAQNPEPQIIPVPDADDPNIKRPMIWNKDRTALIPAPVQAPAGGATPTGQMPSYLNNYLNPPAPAR